MFSGLPIAIGISVQFIIECIQKFIMLEFSIHFVKKSYRIFQQNTRTDEEIVRKINKPDKIQKLVGFVYLIIEMTNSDFIILAPLYFQSFQSQI